MPVSYNLYKIVLYPGDWSLAYVPLPIWREQVLLVQILPCHNSCINMVFPQCVLSYEIIVSFVRPRRLRFCNICIYNRIMVQRTCLPPHFRKSERVVTSYLWFVLLLCEDLCYFSSFHSQDLLNKNDLHWLNGTWHHSSFHIQFPFLWQLAEVPQK